MLFRSLGFRLRHGVDGGVDVLLSKRSLDRIDAKIRELTPRNWGQGIEACIKRLNRFFVGWIGFFGIVSEKGRYELHERDAHARRRLRALQVRQWGYRRHIYRHLRRLGVKASTASRAVWKGNPSTWKLSKSPAVQLALPNKRFARLGLFNLVEAWMRRHQADIARGAQLQLPLS